MVEASEPEGDREARVGLLALQRLAQHLVAAVDADRVAGDVGGGKEREPHDVVPVNVRHEHVVGGFAARPVLGQHAVAELANPGAEIAQHVFVAAGLDLDAGGVAAKGAGYRERQLAVDKRVDGVRSGQAALARRQQRLADFRPHRLASDRGGQRAPRAPEIDAERRGVLYRRLRRLLRLRRRLPCGDGVLGRAEHRQHMVKAGDGEQLAQEVVQPDHGHAAVFRLAPRRRHQRAEPRARDVLDLRQIDDEIAGAARHRGDQLGLKRLAGLVVDAPAGMEYEIIA